MYNEANSTVPSESADRDSSDLARSSTCDTVNTLMDSISISYTGGTIDPYCHSSISDEECTDHFSALPDLCIFEIFKNLKRDEINTISMVSTRMRSIANEKELDSIKFEGGNVLDIRKIENGYLFNLDSYEYMISTTYTGEFIVCKEDYSNLPRITSRKIVSSSTGLLEYFFGSLRKLLRYRQVTVLFLVQTSITLEFVSGLKATLNDHPLTEIDFLPMSDDPNADEGRIMLAEFFKKFPNVEMSSGQNIVNEAFIRTVAQGNLKKLSAADDSHPVRGAPNPADEKADHFFHPDRSILPSLIGYSIIEIPTLTLNQSWIVNLAEMCLEFCGNSRESTKREAWLQFTVDRPLTSEAFMRGLNNAEYKYMEDGGDHFIERRWDKMRARCSTTSYSIEDGSRVLGLSIHVYDEEYHTDL